MLMEDDTMWPIAAFPQWKMWNPSYKLPSLANWTWHGTYYLKMLAPFWFSFSSFENIKEKSFILHLGVCFHNLPVTPLTSPEEEVGLRFKILVGKIKLNITPYFLSLIFILLYFLLWECLRDFWCGVFFFSWRDMNKQNYLKWVYRKENIKPRREAMMLQQRSKKPRQKSWLRDLLS